MSNMIGHLVTQLAKTKGFLGRRGLCMSKPLFEQIKNHSPNNLEKRFLVWTGKYKSIDAVPNLVSSVEMERCRNRVRIRGANIMIGLTILGCILMVISGKGAAKRGESVSKQNLDWHKKYNESQQKQAD